MKIKTENLDRDTLIKIEKIDNSFYINAITGLDWYLERYKPYHKAILLYNDDNDCVGYIAAFPIKKELYDTLINGVLTNDLHINPTMFVEKSDYNYICSCVILEEYRKKGYAQKMFSKLFSNASGKFVALTISQDGFHLANKFMNLKMQINECTHVFEKHI